MVLVVKNLSANAGDIRYSGLIPGSGRSPEGWHANPLQYSCLENHIDRSLAGVHSIAKHQTQLMRLSMRAWMQAHTVFPMWRCYLGSFCNKSGGRCSRNGTCNVWVPRTVPVAWSAAVSVWCGHLQTPACSLVFSGQVHCPRNLSSSPPSLLLPLLIISSTTEAQMPLPALQMT